jgi:hypothetical protein
LEKLNNNKIMISQKTLLEKYGTPNATGAGYLTVIDLPYPMFLNWASSTKVKKYHVIN